MFNRRIVREEDHARLLADIEFWKKAFETERSRADRLHDLLLNSMGRPPVSDENVGEMRKLQERVREAQKEMLEIYEDDEGSSLLSDLLEPETAGVEK